MKQGAGMKSGKWTRLLILAAPLLIGFGAGCGDFWQAPTTTTTTGTCTTNCTTATSGDFYILNAGTTPQIVGDSIVTGALTAISGSPWTLEGAPYSMAIAPNGSFLIVGTTSGVFAYPITNGVLGTAVVVSTDQAFAVQVDATDSWLIEAIPGESTGSVAIGAIPIVSTTGAGKGTEQTVSFTVTNATLQANRMVISSDNANLFVALGAGGTIVVPFNAGVAAGANPLGSKAAIVPVANAGGSALSVAVDPSTTPRLFYIGETLASGGTNGGLRVYNYSSLGTTTLTQAAGSPIASGGLAPNFILPVASGEYVYVANGTGASTAGNVTGFTITSSGAVTPTYTVATDTATAAGVQPLGMAEDSTSTFVFAVGSLGSPFFDAYTFDSTSLGQLDSQITSTTSAGSVAIVAAP
jgi:6-phosphogluconolactonase